MDIAKYFLIITLLSLTPALRANIVHEIPPGELAQDEIYFIAEIAKGSNKKHELRTATGQIFLDRTICPRKTVETDEVIAVYPINYGISPGRFNVDQDPLDLLVLGGEQVFAKELNAKAPVAHKVKVLSLMVMEECDNPPCAEEKWVKDEKVIAYLDEGKIYSGEEIRQVQKQLKSFFSNYKGGVIDAKDKKFYSYTRVRGFASQQAALDLIKTSFPLRSSQQRQEEIKACRQTYDRVGVSFKKDKKLPLTQNAQFLVCLQRVHDERFFPQHAEFDLFLKYSAAQRLLELGNEKVTLENAIEKMAERSKAGKSFYRFVGFDRPSPPGTGKPVFEWVLTKNRNKGCAENFPQQHYQSRPLVDIEK